MDIESVIKYFVVHNFSLNFDSYTGQMIHNYYLCDNNGILSMLPWDYNLAFGGFMSVGGAEALVNYPLDNPVSSGDMSSRPMISWIFSNEQYKEKYHSYMDSFISQVFDSGYFETKFQAVYKILTPYVRSEKNAFCTFEEFQKGAQTLKEFCLLRAESIKGQLAGTIPSTTEAQKADSSALIKAENIVISDMGSMGMGGSFKKGDFVSSDNESSPDGNSDSLSGNGSTSLEQQPPQTPNGETPDLNGERPQLSDGEMSEFGNGAPPNFPSAELPDFNGEPPEIPNGEMPNFNGFSP